LFYLISDPYLDKWVVFSNTQRSRMRNKLLFFIAIVIPPLFFVGCPSNPEPPTPALSISTDCFEKTACGVANWQVTFSVGTPSPMGGWIVQKITLNRDVKRCNNESVPINPNPLIFWEAWPVKANSTLPLYRQDQGVYLDGVFYPQVITYDDLFRVPFSCTVGFDNITGVAKFFPGLTLPPTFSQHSGIIPAGILHATTEPPDFWNETGAIPHRLMATWDCCTKPSPGTCTTSGTHNVTTVPTATEKPCGGTMRVATDADPLLDLIYKIPAWTLGYDSDKTERLTDIARQLSKVSTAQLRSLLSLFVQKESSIDELSKVYLLLRVLYNLPEKADPKTVKVFGGWVLPSNNSLNVPYNLSWPIATTHNNLIIVSGTFYGYLGTPYVAVAEFDYFNQNFTKRVL
jgi:hypothetical protein